MFQYFMHTHHLEAGGQFEQQPAVFVQVASREVEERHQEVGHGGVLLAALRQPLEQLGALPEEISLERNSVRSVYGRMSHGSSSKLLLRVCVCVCVCVRAHSEGLVRVWKPPITWKLPTALQYLE